ncbi:MAG: hypothetical protein LBC80_03155 [Treponema sp.]|jgi:hypothetical protein|nr:hypothetical protein [Treponema sp.]
MKKTIIAFFLLAGLVVIPAMAQDLESSRPKMFSFSVGIPIGYDLVEEDLIGGTNFGVGIVVADNLEVGFERMLDVNLLRVAFAFTDQIGVGIGYGAVPAGGGDPAVPHVILGMSGTFFEARAANGIAYNMGIRVDYLAPTSGFGDGKVLFVLRTSFGL